MARLLKLSEKYDYDNYLISFKMIDSTLKLIVISHEMMKKLINKNIIISENQTIFGKCYITQEEKLEELFLYPFSTINSMVVDTSVNCNIFGIRTTRIKLMRENIMCASMLIVNDINFINYVYDLLKVKSTTRYLTFSIAMDYIDSIEKQNIPYYNQSIYFPNCYK